MADDGPVSTRECGRKNTCTYECEMLVLIGIDCLILYLRLVHLLAVEVEDDERIRLENTAVSPLQAGTHEIRTASVCSVDVNPNHTLV